MDGAIAKRLMAAQLANEAAIYALIASHPDQAYFQKLLAGFSEASVVFLLGYHWEDRYREQLEAKIESFRQLSEKYARTPDPKK